MLHSNSPTASPLRIALVSTPRSGNTWFRYLLADAYQLVQIARHSMSPTDWTELPREVILQMHWRREPEFLQILRDHGFRVVNITRHPFDVLISILHFCWFEPQTDHWLLGSGGNERSILGAMPRSRCFIEYATGPRAAELLAVSCDWWQFPKVLSVRYEALVQDPYKVFQEIQAQLGPIRCPSLKTVLENNRIDRLQSRSTNNHFWKGKPGLWRKLLTATEVQELRAALDPILDRLGYCAEPDPHLTPSQADRNWITLVGEDLRQKLSRAA